MRAALFFTAILLGAPTVTRVQCNFSSGVTCETHPCGGDNRSAAHQGQDVCQGDSTWPAPILPCEISAPGAVCGDGTIYAGLTPDGDVPMYTTPADAGLFAWNDANSNGYTMTSQTSKVTGRANTTALNGLDSNSAFGGVQPHRAAHYCANLVAHGHSDWYLPARDELNVLWVNRNAIGGFNVSGLFPAGWYWSSSEHTSYNVMTQRFSVGIQYYGDKDGGLSVRCIRK